MKTRYVGTLLAVAVMVIASTAASAQLAALKQTTPQQRATILTNLMEKRFGLSGDELQKVSAINLEYANKAQPILDGANRPLEQMREMKQLSEQKDAALKTAMTPAHFQQYLATKDELRQKFEKHIMQGGSAPPAGAPQ